MRQQTPLRYPGGKARLGPFFGELVRANGLCDGTYVEPFAGGAGVAIHLLLGEFIDSIYINDVDEAVYAFWRAILDHSDEFCALVESVPLTPREWRRQKKILTEGLKSSEPLSLGFAMFYLNRTNRSGILNGGMIGGKKQSGEWKLDVRFNRDELVQRIRKLSRYRGRIHTSNEDALSFLRQLTPKLRKKTLLYLDPPFYAKGQHLYANFYRHDDHRQIAEFVSSIEVPWVISYDDHSAVRSLYSAYRRSRYSLGYSARERRIGSEVMFFSPDLVVPKAPLHCEYVFPTAPQMARLQNREQRSGTRG
jgi:DNA adenine methylase